MFSADSSPALSRLAEKELQRKSLEDSLNAERSSGAGRETNMQVRVTELLVLTLHRFISQQEFGKHVRQCAEQEYGLKTTSSALPERVGAHLLPTRYELFNGFYKCKTELCVLSRCSNLHILGFLGIINIDPLSLSLFRRPCTMRTCH